MKFIRYRVSCLFLKYSAFALLQTPLNFFSNVMRSIRRFMRESMLLPLDCFPPLSPPPCLSERTLFHAWVWPTETRASKDKLREKKAWMPFFLSMSKTFKWISRDTHWYWHGQYFYWLQQPCLHDLSLLFFRMAERRTSTNLFNFIFGPKSQTRPKLPVNFDFEFCLISMSLDDTAERPPPFPCRDKILEKTFSAWEQLKHPSPSPSSLLFSSHMRYRRDILSSIQFWWLLSPLCPTFYRGICFH